MFREESSDELRYIHSTHDTARSIPYTVYLQHNSTTGRNTHIQESRYYRTQYIHSRKPLTFCNLSTAFEASTNSCLTKSSVRFLGSDSFTLCSRVRIRVRIRVRVGFRRWKLGVRIRVGFSLGLGLELRLGLGIGWGLGLRLGWSWG